MHILVSLLIVSLLGGLFVSFVFPWDEDRKHKPRMFAGAGTFEKPIKPEKYNEIN